MPTAAARRYHEQWEQAMTNQQIDKIAALEAKVRELEPRAAFGDQCFQALAEGSLIEQTVVNRIRKELKAQADENEALRAALLRAAIRELTCG